MTSSFSEMNFETHLSNYSHYLNKNAENDRYFTQQAQESHALAVWDGSQKLIFQTLSAEQHVSSEQAKFHIRFGLGRRSQSIWYSFRELHYLIPPSRTEPLLADEANRASELLNSIYINIAGALDNFAWCFHFHFCSEPPRIIKEQNIGLFNPTFLKDERLQPIIDTLKIYEAWRIELKKLRDPAAHRIPLSAVPSIQDRTSLAELEIVIGQVNAKTAEFNIAVKNLQHERALEIGTEIEELNLTRQKIGSYVPLFEFDPSKQPIAIYPTVVQDIGKYVCLSNDLHSVLRASSA
jgi:hypothetical protein